jgi:O-antigen ligase
MKTRRIVFDWQIWLLALAAIVSWLLAYNTRLATLDLLLIAIGIAVYLIMANLPDPTQWHGQPRSALAAILATLPAIIALYFLLTNEWSRWIGKLSVFDPILRVLAAWPLSSIGLGVNPNVIGGVTAALLPLQIYALRNARRWIAVILIGLSSVALLLSETRGAWLALALVTGMWLLWRFIVVRQSQVRRARWMWLIIVVIVGLAGAVILSVTPLGERLLDLSGDRTQIWRNSLDLIGDYPLTGFGLGDFEMTYSTYVLLIHVGHTMHAHNLWLNVWLNLGLLGVLALLGMTVNAVWPKSSSPWRMAALMALGVLLLHTLVDDSIFGYGGIGIPIIFIPLGLLARSGGANTAEATSKRRRLQPALSVWSAALTALIIGLIAPQGRAAAEANIGALRQTRAELSVYHWPEIPLQDALRRLDQVDLTAAMQHYQIALALDPTEAVANRRLGQIELARSQYNVGCQQLAAAFAANPYQRATRQLLGECDAFSEQSAQGVALWRSIDLGESQLDLRLWWYQDYLNDHKRADQMKQAIAQLQ